jgi:hypothetical protein
MRLSPSAEHQGDEHNALNTGGSPSTMPRAQGFKKYYAGNDLEANGLQNLVVLRGYVFALMAII